MFSAFFIERPKFALVISIALTLVGGLSIYLVPQTALSGTMLTTVLIRDIAVTAIIWYAIRLALRPPIAISPRQA